MIEEWAQIERYPGYLFSDHGGCRSRWKRGPGGYWHDHWIDLSPHLVLGKYLKVGLRVAPLRTEFPTLGALVLEAFSGPAPGPEYECRFLDRDGTNCHLSNLVWATRAEIARGRRSRFHLALECSVNG